jgi:hypothetical protein
MATSPAQINSTITRPPSAALTSQTHLATRAKVGIAVGAVLGVALLCISAWLLYLHYQSKKSTEGQSFEMSAPVPVQPPAETGDAELEAKHGHSEAIGPGRPSGFTEHFDLPAGPHLEVGEEGTHERGHGGQDSLPS